MDLVSLVSAYRAHNISHVLGKTTDVINKLIRPDLPYRRYYSHVFIFNVQFSDPSPSNPWNRSRCLLLAICGWQLPALQIFLLLTDSCECA